MAVIPPLPLAQALPCLSMRARLTVVFPTALLGFLLWTLPCLSMGTRLTGFPDFQRACARGKGGTDTLSCFGIRRRPLQPPSQSRPIVGLNSKLESLSSFF